MMQPKRASSNRIRIVPALLQTEDKLTRHWRGQFLATLAETSNVTAAAAAAGVHPSRPYKVRREDPAFADQWYEALCEGYDHLEMELLHRLRFGEPKTEQERRFDTGAAIRQLAAHRETVARVRAGSDTESAESVRASIDEKLARLRAKVMARAASGEEAGDEPR